jgi:hypothetical protein
MIEKARESAAAVSRDLGIDSGMLEIEPRLLQLPLCIAYNLAWLILGVTDRLILLSHSLSR